MAVVPAAPLNKLRAFHDEVLKGEAMNHRAEADDLHHHVFSLLQRAHCLLLPQIGNNQSRPQTRESLLEDVCSVPCLQLRRLRATKL